jgi:hypothetical protein
MTTMLFYKTPVLLNREQHRHLRIKPTADGYKFAAQCNAIPLTSSEFVSTCREYVIVFVMANDGSAIPSVMTGLRDEENLFVNETGQWDAEYIPAFVRRYPFLVQDDGDEGRSLVMLDQDFPGFGAEDGEALFNDDGSDSTMLTKTLQFLEDGRIHIEYTSEFMARLRKYDLLIPHTIEAVTSDNKKYTMQGFSVVDEQRLGALSDEQLIELVRSGDLGRIHAHLLSLNNVGKLSRLLDDRLAMEASE